MTPRNYGMLLCLSGIVLLSPDVLAVRWLQLDHSSLLFWRGMMLTLGFLCVVLIRYRSGTFSAICNSGWVGIGSGLAFALSTYCFTQAMLLTSATAAMMIISASPIFAAIISWVFLGEGTSSRTLMTIALAFSGICVIMTDHSGYNSLSGNLFAFGTAVFMAVNFNLARKAAPRDLSPSLVLGGLFAACLALLHRPDLSPPALPQLGVIALTSVILMPIGFTLLQIAPRYLPATEVSLFLLLEAILGPLWVWLVLNEAPSYQTLGGSLIVCAALIYNALAQKPLNALQTEAR